MTHFGNYKSYACGGSVINDRYVLTAAKCVKLFPPEMLSVVIGARKGNETNTLPAHEVSHVIVHEKYARFFRRRRKHVFNDIALLKLKTPLPLKEDFMMGVYGDKIFTPVCLPFLDKDGKERVFSKDSLFVSGWAYPALGGSFPSPPDLIDSPVFEHDSKACGRFYSKILRFDEKNVICAGGTKGVCFKDEGSPLLSKQEGEGGHVFQQGLVSVSRGFADCSFKPKVPTVFERVSVHLEWIQSKTKDAKWCNIPDKKDDDGDKSAFHEGLNEVKEMDFDREDVKEKEFMDPPYKKKFND